MNKLLHTTDLSIRAANKVICKHLNFSLHAGEVWGVLGQNGAGKTTLLHAFAGLNAAQGDIFLQGKNLLHLSKKNIAQQLGILLQDTMTFFPQTVFEFCLSGRFPHLNFFAWENAQDKEIVLRALTEMELDNKLTQKVHTLSGGERRRLAIATLLTQAPQVYLLDEPTNHLDLRQQLKVLQHLQKLTFDNAAVMMSLHEPQIAARFCSHVLLLFEQTEVLFGPTHHILTRENLARLYGCNDTINFLNGTFP